MCVVDLRLGFWMCWNFAGFFGLPQKLWEDRWSPVKSWSMIGLMKEDTHDITSQYNICFSFACCKRSVALVSGLGLRWAFHSGRQQDKRHVCHPWCELFG